MESCDSSPNYMKATSSSHAKKEVSPQQGGSEFDDIISISSSNCGSSVNNSGIKYRTNNKKMMTKNIRSFRRRAKSRIITPALEISDDSSSSPHESLVDESESFHSPQSKGSCPSHRSFPSLSRTPSNRNVRILLKKASFKPKRSSLSHTQLSGDISVNRPTYSSTLKDSKFPEPVEIHPLKTETERISTQKICRYHHCSLHGHCHGPHDPAPPVKRFLYKKRLSMKKQKSMISRHDSKAGINRLVEKQKKLPKKQMVSVSNPSAKEGENGGVVFSSVKGKKGMESYVQIGSKGRHQNPGDGYWNMESDFAEIAFGETSFPERSYKENLEILENYSSDFGGLVVYGYCLKCWCSLREQIAPISENADSGNHEIPKTRKTNVSDTDSSSLLSKPVESRNVEARETSNEESLENEGLDKDFPNTPVISDEISNKKGPFSSTLLNKPVESVNVEEREASNEESCENDEGFDKHFPDTPVMSDEIFKRTDPFSSVSDSQVSSGSNSELEGEFTAESGPSLNPEDSNVKQVEEDEANIPIPTHGVTKLLFSKQRHISMWHLIHQHMSSNLSTESANNPQQASSGDGTQVERSNSQPITKKSLAPVEGLSDSEKVAEDNESETQEIEIRKMFAIKLVREAIEKILLPEVQDDQSERSESTPRPELFESNENKAFVQESSVQADKQEGNTSVNTEDGSSTANDASGSETAKTKEKIVSKSEKKAPKHWSNLKKWILLQRFIKELEKVKKFNPRTPRLLPLTPDPEAEKVSLRPQTLDERKKSEEWMLDYAIRQAVSQLAPTQKRKVALLVKAFETVVPPQEEPQIQFRIPTLMDMVNNGISSENKNELPLDGNNGVSSLDTTIQENGNKLIEKTVKALNLERTISDEKGMKAKNLGLGILQEDRSSSESKETNARQNHIKMWHMIYQHVVSSVAEKVGGQLLDGADEEVETSNTAKSAFASSKSEDFSFQKNEFTKADALKLVKEAVDEILLPETQDNSQEGGESSIRNEPHTPNLKNWSKLKKLMVLKRSIRALEKARNQNPKSVFHQNAENMDLRHQMMDERNKAEQWMYDYAVQHIVTKLTPARKRRVSMLVEAFEAVVPFPES